MIESGYFPIIYIYANRIKRGVYTEINYGLKRDRCSSGIPRKIKAENTSATKGVTNSIRSSHLVKLNLPLPIASKMKAANQEMNFGNINYRSTEELGKMKENNSCYIG